MGFRVGGLAGCAVLLDGGGDDRPEHLKLLWRRQGLAAFDANAGAKEAGTPKEDSRARSR